MSSEEIIAPRGAKDIPSENLEKTIAEQARKLEAVRPINGCGDCRIEMEESIDLTARQWLVRKGMWPECLR